MLFVRKFTGVFYSCVLSDINFERYLRGTCALSLQEGFQKSLPHGAPPPLGPVFYGSKSIFPHFLFFPLFRSSTSIHQTSRHLTTPHFTSLQLATSGPHITTPHLRPSFRPVFSRSKSISSLFLFSCLFFSFSSLFFSSSLHFCTFSTLALLRFVTYLFIGLLTD